MKIVDLTEAIGDYYFNQIDFMGSDFFKLNWKDVLGAAVSSVLVSVLQLIANWSGATHLDWHAIAVVAVTVGATSLLKALGTTTTGKFAGVLPVK